MKPTENILSIVFLCLLLFVSYYVAKHGSYYFWYEDMVKQTIKEMVKQEALKN